MKRTIIPDGTPGTFRPEWGQFPEPNSTVIAWFYAIEEDGPELVPVLLPAPESEEYQCYAWQYAPVAPPVDGFEAFKAMWEEKNFGFAIGFNSYHSDEEMLFIGREVFGSVSNLESAQRISYDHFLSTLNS